MVGSVCGSWENFFENLIVELAESTPDNNAWEEESGRDPNPIRRDREKVPNEGEGENFSERRLQFIVENGSNRATLSVEKERGDWRILPLRAIASKVLSIGANDLILAIAASRRG